MKPVDVPGAATPAGAPPEPALSAAPASGASLASPALPAEPAVPLRLLAVVVGFVLVVGVGGWLWRGNAPGLAVGPADAAQARAAAAQMPTAEQIEGMLNKLRERLKQQPDDVEGWTMMARSMAVLGRAQEAVPAWRRVAELQPQSAKAWADLADGVATANGGNLDGEPAQLIAKALQLDPKQPKALALAGSAAFQQGDFARAAGAWQLALTQLEPGSDFARQLEAALAEARQRQAEGPAGAGSQAAAALPAPSASASASTSVPASGAGAATATAAAGGRVAGRVRLAAAVADRVQPGDTLFIFARPADGSRMPLAILRRTAGELPLDFVLDDSLAMNPAMKLSGQPRVIVGARISRSGQALPQPGDLQGFTAPVAVGSEGLVLEIGELVR